MRTPKDLSILLILSVTLLAGPPSRSEATVRINGLVGAGYLLPRDGIVSDLYGHRLSLQLGVSAWMERPGLFLELEGGFSRSSATLSRPFFVSSAESELLLVPIDLVARFPLRRTARLTPYLGAGLEALWSEESFQYRFQGDEGERTQSPDRQIDLGFLLVAGIERSTMPRLRLEGFLSVVPIDRRLHAGQFEYEETDSGFDAGSLGLRLGWRFP